jgi:hypothetical protein
VDVWAAARTASGGEVLLVVESERTPQGPGGAADVETALSFEGQGQGLHAGVLNPASAAVAGRWVGSGKRTGRLWFALRAASPGRYTLPVRFVLTAP